MMHTWKGDMATMTTDRMTYDRYRSIQEVSQNSEQIDIED